MSTAIANISLPTLYHKTKTGATQTWRIWVEGSVIVTEYGQLDGKMQISRETAEPKNVGRSNETTAEEQAVLQAQSQWQHKRDRKYSETIEDTEEKLFLPMLAHKFEDKKKGVKYPVHVQPKLDGFRALASWKDGKVVLTSRSGKPFNAPEHIIQELEGTLPPNSVLDGELYVHGVPFETVSSWIKKNRPDTIKLGYHIYDCPVWGGKEGVWEERLRHLTHGIFHEVAGPYDHLHMVVTYTAENEADVARLHEDFVTNKGYEGAIVRMLDAPYLWGYRSSSLLKVKAMDDAEFKCVGVEHGVGKFEDCGILVCATSAGKEFRATPKGTTEHRQSVLANKKDWIGQEITVQYFGLTSDGIPRFPVAKGRRLPEDK